MTIPHHVLPRALLQPGHIRIVSNRWLADDVTDVVQNALGTNLAARPVPEIGPRGRLNALTPLGLLHALGRATSSLPALNQAGAAGLAGLTALHMSSQWAILKYLWAFDAASPELRFSAIANNVRAHQRAVFSEQIGIAVATSVVERLLRPPAKGSLRIVDADALVDDPLLHAAVGVLDRHRPDYFFYTGGPNPSLFIVEVKGTSTTRQTMVRQLARGVQQVSSVGRIETYDVRRVVIGTIATNRMVAYAVEVPDHSQDDHRTRELWKQIVKSRSRDVKPEFREPLVAADELDAVDELATTFPKEVVDTALDRGEDARLLTVAGLAADRESMLRDRSYYVASAADLPRREIGDISYSGTTVRVQSAPGSALAVFAGVERDLLAAASQPAAGRKDVLRRAAESGRITETSAFEQPRTGNLPPSMVSQSPDGCVVEITEQN